MADETDHEIITISSDEETSKPQMITSPKLSLKRKRITASPDSKLSSTQQNGYSSDSSYKKVKSNHLMAIEYVPSLKQIEYNVEEKSLVPSISKSTEETNKMKFLELLEFSKTLMNETPEKEKAKISKNMLKQLESTEKFYVASEEFISVLESSYTNMKKAMHKGNDDVFIILSKLRNELKKYKMKRNPFKIESGEDTNTSPFPSTPKNCILEGKKMSLFPAFAASQSLTTNSSMTISPGESVENKSTNLSAYELCVSLSQTLKSATNKDNSEIETCNVSNDALSIALPSTSEDTSFLNKDNIANEKPIALNSNLFMTELPESKVVEACNNKESVPSPVNLASEYLIDSESVKSTISSNSCIVNTEQAPYLETAVVPYAPEMDKSSFPKEWVICGRTFNSFTAISHVETSSSVTEAEKHNSNATSSHTSSSSTSKSVNINQSSKHSSSSNEAIKTSDKHCFKNDPYYINASKNVSEIKVNETISKLKIASESKKAEKKERDIKKLERTLARLDKQIKKLKAKELTLDDMEDPDSAYILEDRYIKRFNTAWRVLCKLTKQPTRTGRVVEKKLAFAGSRHSAINEAVQKMINKRKIEEKFPNYVDVLTLVKKMNDDQDIGLSQKEIETEAERVFRDVGRELQWRRTRDHEDLFGCHLTDDFDPNKDPAEHDEKLRSVLNDNYKKFEDSVAEIIDKYVEKQKEANEKSEDEENQKNNTSGDDDEESEDEYSKLAEDVDKLTDVASDASPNINNRNESSDDDNDVVEIAFDSDKSTEPNPNVDNIDMNKLAESKCSSSKNHSHTNSNKNKSSKLSLHKDSKPQESLFKITSLNNKQGESASDIYPHKDKQKENVC